jgi:tRNA(fMet)-specific endonuclease VapC
MKYLLDTNILLHFIRQDSIYRKIETDFAPLNAPHQAFVSAVSLGEIESISLQRKWGESKLAALLQILSRHIVIEVYDTDIIRRYAEIDTFSQGLLAGQPLGLSARNMGKNDLWIAATASLLGAKLLTTDADFDHLDGVFLDLGRVQPGLT